jgi:NAD(P)-dependent dehydrogenase (short-subunit alcohol dehydrogenase family)
VQAFKNKTAVIIGATNGIGLVAAKEFVEAGADVVISGRRDGQAIATELGARFVRADVGDPESVAALFEQAAGLLGKIDIVVNTAGIVGDMATIEEMPLDNYDLVCNVNQRGTFVVLKYAPRYMNDGGSIITLSSVSGMLGVGTDAAYCVSKAGIINLTRSSALELAERGIRVNCISPGPVETDMWPDSDPLKPMIDIVTPLGRIAAPEDMTAVIRFLASDASRFITGQNIPVDGGITAGPTGQMFESLIASLDAS